MPKPLVLPYEMRIFVDNDHSGKTVKRRSRSGYSVFLKSAPIYWNLKKHALCDTSTFRSEFVALKQSKEYTLGLHYKLIIFGIPVTESSFVSGDNQSVLCNTTAPQSTLKKKSNAIAFHFVREGCSQNKWRTTYINTHCNVSNLMINPLAGGKC